MEADRLHVEQLGQNGRQQVLACVLLHVVPAASPIDEGIGFGCFEGIFENMNDPLTLVDHVDDTDAVYGAQIVWLTAGCGVERGTIQYNPGRISGRFEHLRTKGREISIAVIETVGRHTPGLLVHRALQERKKCDFSDADSSKPLSADGSPA